MRHEKFDGAETAVYACSKNLKYFQERHHDRAVIGKIAQ